MLIEVAKHFNSKAKDYQSFWQCWPFNALRKSESSAIFSLLNNIAGKEILELGCGSGFYTRLLLKHKVKHIVAVDLSEKMLKNLPIGSITAIKADASTLAISKKFSYILSSGMLEFVPEPIKVLANTRTLANKNCELVLLLPRPSILGILYKLFYVPKKININLFSKNNINNLAVNTGWKLKTIKKCGLFGYAVKLLV